MTLHLLGITFDLNRWLHQKPGLEELTARAQRVRSAEPTEEGKRRWPPSGYYSNLFPCTCTPECPQDMRHALLPGCRCEACALAKTRTRPDGH